MNRCIVCGSSTQEIMVKSGEIFHACGHCEFIAKDRAFVLLPQDELHHYNQHNNSIDDKSYIKFFDNFLQAAVFPFSKAKVAFDFGSGPTPVLAHILKNSYAFNVDIYDKFYAPKKVYLGKKYPIIVSTEVVEHVQNPMEIFALFSECMERDSILAIMTIFHPQNIQDFKRWFYILDTTHISFFSLKTMEYMADKFGLKILYTDKKRYITFAKKQENF